MVAITPTPGKLWCRYTQKEISVSDRSKKSWSACGVSLWDRTLSKVGACDEKILRWIFVDLFFSIYVEIAPGWTSIMLHAAQNCKSRQPLPPNVFKLKKPKSQSTISGGVHTPLVKALWQTSVRYINICQVLHKCVGLRAAFLSKLSTESWSIKLYVGLVTLTSFSREEEKARLSVRLQIEIPVSLPISLLTRE